MNHRPGKRVVPLAVAGVLLTGLTALWLGAGSRPILRPGADRICGDCIVPGVDTLLVLIRNEQGGVTLVRRNLNITEIDSAGTDRIIRHESKVRYTETYVLARSTLTPIHTRRILRDGKVDSSIEFSGLQVTGSVKSGNRDIPVQVSVPRAAFLANSVDLVAGAIAGEHPFSAEVAFFSPEDQSTPEYYNLTVIGRTTVTLHSGQTCSGILVRHKTPGSTADFLIDERTRRLLHWQIVSPASPGTAWLETSRCPLRANPAARAPR